MESWEYGAVGIANPEYSPLRRYFELIENTQSVNGDIAEFGVSRGSSLITTALISRQLNSGKKIYGFDTFEGFPGYSKNDDFELFNQLHTSKKITDSHFKKIILNRDYILVRGANTDPSSISNSADFSNTSLELVQKKIDFFKLNENVKLIQGDFTQGLRETISGLNFSLVLLDSDLYDSYANTLPIIWDHLSRGGYIYLDEYYSLKFPGPRIAVDSFVNQNDCQLVRLEDWLDFERWAIFKK